jgi:hypothetical protein
MQEVLPVQRLVWGRHLPDNRGDINLLPAQESKESPAFQDQVAGTSLATDVLDLVGESGKGLRPPAAKHWTREVIIVTDEVSCSTEIPLAQRARWF